MMAYVTVSPGCADVTDDVFQMWSLDGTLTRVNAWVLVGFISSDVIDAPFLAVNAVRKVSENATHTVY